MSSLSVPGLVSPNLYDKLNGELLRNSATELQFGQRNCTSGRFQVDKKLVDLTTPKTLPLGGLIADLIEGGSPSADTLYSEYIYDDGLIGLSATAPLANGYRTGDEYNRFIGAVYLDGSKECAEEWNFCGFGNTICIEDLASTITRTSGAGVYVMMTLANVVTLPGTVITASYRTRSKSTGSTRHRSSISDGTLTGWVYGYMDTSVSIQYPNRISQKIAAISEDDYVLSYEYFSGTHTIDILKATIQRSTI